jgi:hypothetical protein
MEVLKESFPDDRIIVDINAQLFKQEVDIGLQLMLSSLCQKNNRFATFINNYMFYFAKIIR